MSNSQAPPVFPALALLIAVGVLATVLLDLWDVWIPLIGAGIALVAVAKAMSRVKAKPKRR